MNLPLFINICQIIGGYLPILGDCLPLLCITAAAALCIPWIYTGCSMLLLNQLLTAAAAPALLHIWCTTPNHWRLRRGVEYTPQLLQKYQHLSHLALIIVHLLHNELPEVVVIYRGGLLKLLPYEFKVSLKIFRFFPAF